MSDPKQKSDDLPEQVEQPEQGGGNDGQEEDVQVTFLPGPSLPTCLPISCLSAFWRSLRSGWQDRSSSISAPKIF